MPHTDFPRTNYPDQLYDWAAPYDWAIEEMFPEAPQDEVHEPDRALTYGVLRRLRDAAFVGAAVIAAVVAVNFMAYEAKKQFFDPGPQDVPAKLPKPVSDESNTAVKVVYGSDLSTGGDGSGVKIGPDTVLTAGHMVLLSDPRGISDCYGSYTLNVNTPGFYSRDPILGSNAIYNGSRDIAVLRVGEDEDFAELPTATVAANQPGTGEPVFFINYEAGGHSKFLGRYPNDQLARQLGYKDIRSYGHPAEYGGVVLGHDGSDLVVMTGEEGYGPENGRQMNSHHGASGGPVFNRAGKVIGLSVAIESLNEFQITSQFNVAMPLSFSDRDISLVQPVTQGMVNHMLSGLPEGSNC